MIWILIIFYAVALGIFRQHVVFFFDMSYTEIYSKDPK